MSGVSPRRAAVSVTERSAARAAASSAGTAASLHQRLGRLRARLAQRTERHRLIIERYRADILPLESELSTQVLALTHRLIDQYARRELAMPEQILLGLWIEDHLKNLDPRSSGDDAAVSHVGRRWRGIIQDGDSMVDLQLAKLRATHERDAAQDSRPVAAHETGQDTGDPARHNEGPSPEAMNAPPRKADMASSSVPAGTEPVTLLFRRLARRLHPDRENDVERKAQKDALMAECLAARQADDLGALLALCETHVGPLDTIIDDEQFAAMGARLRLEIRQTEARLARLQSDDPFNAMIVSRYQEDSDEAVLQRFFTHRVQLEKALRGVREHLSTLLDRDGLHDLLEERRAIAFDRLTISELTGLSS